MRWGAESYSEWETTRLRARRRRRVIQKIGLVVVFLGAFAVAWEYLPPSINVNTIYRQWPQAWQARKWLVFYPNCAAARAAGAAPIRMGEPGYRLALDADHDGIACEPIPAFAR